MRVSNWTLLFPGLLLWSAGCGEDGPLGAKVGARQSALSAAAATEVNTFIRQHIEIDQLGATPPQDANLFRGADPADGTASAQKPAVAGATYIDWDDLGADLANHRLLDLNDSRGRDPSSFPRSNECVGSSSVLSKMDLTYVASANNSSYAYFGVQRANNSGDAGYYWLFTKLPPRQNMGESPCRADEFRLAYDISGPSADGGTGDVMLVGHFTNSSTPSLRVFRARTSMSNVGAVSAVDFTNTALWTEDATAVKAAAVNTTKTRPGAFGAAGVGALVGGDLDIELFAESAIPLTSFAGTSATGLCTAKFYGSVVTRSSGSGGTSPDLKDLAGPAFFNFAPVTAKLEGPTVNCDRTVSFKLSAVPASSTSTCTVTVDDGQTFTGCDTPFTTLPLSVGTHTLTVSVSDSATTCADSKTYAVTVSDAMTVKARPTARCDRSFGYDVDVTGGSSPTYAWTFSGPGATTPATSSTRSGSVSVSQDGSYTGSVAVTATRPDGSSCTARDSFTVSAYQALSASALLKESCDARTITYEGSATGGSPAGVSYAWTFSGPAAAMPSTSTSASGSFTAGQAGSYTGSLVVTDKRTDITCSSTAATDSAGAYDPLSVMVSLGATCGPQFTYGGVVSGGGPNLSYAWSFSGPGATSPAASALAMGTVDVVTGGAYTGQLVVTDRRADGAVCTTPAASGSVGAYPALQVAASLSASCDSSFGYSGAVSGGSPAGVSYAWVFKDAAGQIVGSSVMASGSVTGLQGGAIPTGGRDYSGALVITDNRVDGQLCTATGSAAARVYSPLGVRLALTSGGGSCPGLASDAVGYQARTSGGSGGFTYQWNGAACSGQSCAIDPADTTLCAESSLSLTVTDAVALCGSRTSETETYSKRTIITASDN